MANKTSQHILSTSANLLGFCLFVITSLHAIDKATSTFVDELTSVIALFLTASCFFSFISIRTKEPAKEQRLETIADYLFVISLAGILIIILLLVFKFVK